MFIVLALAASATVVPVAGATDDEDSPAPQPQAPPASQEKTPPAAAKFAFEDERALKLGWPRLQMGVEIGVCNIGNKEDTFRPRLVGFDFEIDDKPAATAAVIAFEPATVSVKAGECSSLTLKNGAHAPDAGDYGGVIILRTPSELVRREATITAPKVNQTRGEALVEEVRIRALRNGMGDDLEIATPASLPLRGEGERVLVPPKDTTIGVLQNGSDRLEVIVDGAPAPPSSPRYLPIRLEGSDEVGDYTGTVDLAVGEAAPAVVKLKVEASDRLWVPLVLIAVGLGGAMYHLLRLQRWRPERHLHNRREELADRYAEAKTAFDAQFGQARFKEYRPKADDIARYQTTLDRSIRRYAKDNLLFKRESDEFKENVRMLQAAEADAAFFGDRDGFGKSLMTLETTVTEFKTEFPDSVPRFIELAAARLKGKELPVGGATKVAAEVEKYVAFASQWKQMGKQVKRLEAWVAELEKPNVDLNPDERQLLAAAKAKVNEAKMELRDAESAASLEAVGAARDLRRAYGILAVLGSKHGWAPAEKRAQARPLEDITSERFGDRMPETLDELVARAKGLPLVGFFAEAIGRTVRGAADAAVVLVAIGAAILAALPTVVADDTFGSWRDYLLALGLGGTSVVAAKGIVDVVGQLRGRERV